MQKLLTTRDAVMMKRLHDYLQRRGIPVTVSEHGNQLELWLVQSSYKALAKDLINEFKADPSGAEAELQAQTSAHPTHQGSGGPSLAQQLLQQAGLVTIVFAVLVSLVFLGLNTPLAEGIFAQLRISDTFTELPWHQPWRLLTPALLHFSLLHFLFNVFWWWYLGGRFERTYGSVYLVLALVACAVFSNVMQFWVSGPYFGGLSGVVYGLFGIAVIVAWQRPQHPLYLPIGLIGFMLVWLLLGYTDLLWVSVANTAHSAGLIAGLIFGLALRLIEYSKKRTTTK
ncbi:rhomboid family intramembrane serine protease [Pseudidiomarina sediminum]|uniref:Rhomboid family intramembrane serine protease n=1 Tax=Pseudidiomarina sediminum TaxID=431675 RepID=A0A432ZA33_9GAMM|nr:rhomboid family intramembrane serine protease [Pseudidiomarina sediminum]MBY6064016.1 rhomboid family intramembrane serine protease [Pseudidiomarina sediminum]RUO74814.1 rhomboid family intramembrane serine protease [Pseudidiomarina sediminum]